MSDGGEKRTSEARAGPSIRQPTPRDESSSPPSTGNPVVDIATELGPLGETYEREYETLLAYLKRSGDVLGPAAPTVFVNAARTLYRLADGVVSDTQLRPYDKCALLFRIFDAVVLAYKNIAFVYSDTDGARSVYGYSESVLKNLLSRVEAVATKVAAAVHDTYSLTVLNEVVAGAEQRLSQVRSEKDMIEFFRAVSGGSSEDVAAAPRDGVSGAADKRLPPGIEVYGDPYVGVDALLRRLYKRASDRDYVRDFHDALYLLARANAPCSLTGAIETRLADKDRNVMLVDAPGDRTFASALCASAIGYLRRTLNGDKVTATRASADIETYRINYGPVFSKYRGESERNFTRMLEWIKNEVRGGDRFRVFWFPDIENLMSPRTSNDQEHIATIKNAMLQHMDDFNKDKTLRSFLLLFHSSEGVLDSAFARRLETVVRAPVNPLSDFTVATETVGAELARYRINLSDDAVVRVARSAANGSTSARPDESSGSSSSRVGGLAFVQAVLRDMYVNQKLVLKYGAFAVNVGLVSHDLMRNVFGRYIMLDDESSAPPDVLYDLDGRAIDDITTIDRVTFASESCFASHFEQTVPVRYNSSVRGDPKDISERDAARIVFLNDNTRAEH